jgi:hypothetical protein
MGVVWSWWVVVVEACAAAHVHLSLHDRLRGAGFGSCLLRCPRGRESSQVFLISFPTRRLVPLLSC